MSAVHVTADRSLCSGSGNCVRLAPEVFDQDDDGVVVVVRPEPPEELAGEVRHAVELCPVGALSAR